MIQQPAIFPAAGQLNDAGGFQFLESGVPEFEVKNFAFASEQVVGNSETSHGFQVQADDGVGDDLRDFGFFAAVFFDGFQGSSAKFGGAGFVFFKKVRSFGVEIPAVVIEARLHGRHFYADGTEAFHVEKADDDVGDLHAGVVNVVLHLNGMAGVAQDRAPWCRRGRRFVTWPMCAALLGLMLVCSTITFPDIFWGGSGE